MGMASSGISLASKYSTFLALVGLTSIDGVTIKITYRVDAQQASHTNFSYWIG